MSAKTLTFGEQLRDIREAQHLTRRQVEDLSGVSQRQIEYLEKNQKDPRRETLQALAEALGPEVLKAAFPNLVGSPPRRPSKRSIPGYLDLTATAEAERRSPVHPALVRALDAA